MTERELVELIEKESGQPRRRIERFLKSLKKHIGTTVLQGETVVLRGFGSFILAEFKKKPLFGQKAGRGSWQKIKFIQSRRRSHGKVRGAGPKT